MRTVARTVPWGSERVLGQIEHLVPEPRLEMALQLRQVEIGTAATFQQLPRIVKKVEPEVEEAGRHRLAVHQNVLLVQMPAARPHHERRELARPADSAFPPDSRTRGYPAPLRCSSPVPR